MQTNKAKRYEKLSFLGEGQVGYYLYSINVE